MLTKVRQVSEADRAFGQRVQQAFRDAGYKTQRAMAAAIDTPQSNLNMIINRGRRPSKELMDRICGVTGKSLVWFLSGEQETLDRLLADALEDILWRIAVEGEKPGAAFDAVAADPRWLSPAVRQRLEELEPSLIGYLRSQAGGAWEELTAVGKRAIVRAVARYIVSQQLGKPANGSEESGG